MITHVGKNNVKEFALSKKVKSKFYKILSNITHMLSTSGISLQTLTVGNEWI